MIEEADEERDFFKEAIYNPLLYTTEQLGYLVEITQGRCPFGVDYSHRLEELKKHYERRLELSAVDYVDWNLKEIRRRNMATTKKKAKKTAEEMKEIRRKNMAKARLYKTTPGRIPVDPALRKRKESISINPRDLALLNRLGKNKSNGLSVLCDLYRAWEDRLFE